MSVIQIDSGDRMAGYVLRTSYYVAAAVTWLYLVNTEDRLSSKRVMRALLVLWGAAVIGGLPGPGLLTRVVGRAGRRPCCPPASATTT